MGFQRFYLIAGAFFCVKLVGEGYAVSFRLGAPGDAGMVPLRGSQIPGSRRAQAETHRCGMVGRKVRLWQREGTAVRKLTVVGWRIGVRCGSGEEFIVGLCNV